MKIRDYQKKILEETIDKFNKYDKLLCTSSMGSGKSFILSKIAEYYVKNLEFNIVILVNISELINHISNHLNKLNLEHNIIKSKHEFNQKENEKKCKIWLIMEQSFHKNKRDKFNIDCDLLIKDEYHIGYNKKRFSEIFNYFSPKYTLGLTGTPIDEQGYLLSGFTQEQLIEYGSSKELTEKGYLVPLKCYIPKWSEEKDYTNIKITNNDYNQKELNKIINTHKNAKLILRSMNEMNAKNKKTIVYASSIEHAEKIFKELKIDGYNVAIVHSKIKQKENEKTLSLFSNNIGENSIDCIVSVSKLMTGFDEPNIELLVLTRPTKILRLYLQIVFRAARINGKKKYAEILDLSQSISEHGFPTSPRVFTNKPVSFKRKDKKRKMFNKIIKDIIEDKPTILNEETLKLKMKEYKIETLNIKDTCSTNLYKMFNNTYDIEELIYISYEINYRINNINYTNEEIKVFLNNINKDLYIQKKDILKLKDILTNNIRNKKRNLIKIFEK